MNERLHFWPAAITLFIALTVSYVLCIAGDVLFGWTMYQAWMPLLPGFTWPVTLAGFVLGLVWIALYSLYVPALLIFPYRYLTRRGGAQAQTPIQA